MKYSCPHCKLAMNNKDVLLKGIITCKSCKKESALGSFMQMLTAALIGLVSIFIVSFALQNVIFAAKNVISIGVVVLIFSIAMYLIVRPVPYSNKKGSRT
jgi:hypothetical protein